MILVVESLIEPEEKRCVEGAVVVGVKYIDVYNGCYSCGGKVEVKSEILGECTHCSTTQRLDRCK